MVKLLIVTGVLATLLLGKSLSLPLLENEKLIEGNDLGDGAEIEDQTEIDDAEEIDLSNLDRSFFGKPDNETGEAVAQYNPDTQKVNPEELGSYLEGDILMPNGPGRNGMISKSLRWKQAIVPYSIEGKFSSQELKNIELGMKEYQAKTCIRFKRRSSEADYISIVNDNTGCWSSVGRIGGKQELNLQSPGCTYKAGTFMHEMMHALGFLHEQNRYERDSYITVQWDNIKSGVSHNFNKASATNTDAFGVPYDYGSIMHYSAYAFSVNGQPTILAKKKAADMGQRETFSKKDLQKINNMYKCPGLVNSRPSSFSNELNEKPPKRPSLINMIGSLFGMKSAADGAEEQQTVQAAQPTI